MEIVFSSYDLLYEILDKLELHDIYLQRNVNKNFREVIEEIYNRKWYKLYISACFCIISLKSKDFYFLPRTVQEHRRFVLDELMYKYWVVLINDKNLINCFNYLLEENKDSYIFQEQFLEKKKLKKQYRFMEKYLKLKILENI